MTTLFAQDIGSAFQNAASSGPLVFGVAVVMAEETTDRE